MKEIIDKLSSYNIFNYLLPGVVFSAILENYFYYSLTTGNVFSDVFIFYFAGMVISRVGSLIIEPFLKRISFVKFSSYQDYVDACRKDELIEKLSEANNTYRTLLALFFTVFIISGYKLLASYFIFFEENIFTILLIFLFLLFILSYKKQTQYINNRVKAAK